MKYNISTVFNVIVITEPVFTVLVMRVYSIALG